MAPSASSSSLHKSNDTDPYSSPTSRPKPHTAATIIPALHPTESPQVQRSRSKTSSVPPCTNPALRRRAGTTPHARLAPLDVERATLSIKPATPQRLASLPDVHTDRPSSPIPIPLRQKQRSPPTIPLTARARSPVNYFGFAKPRPHISESLTPYYTSAGRIPTTQPASGDPVVQRGFVAMVPPSGSPLYGCTPTSPLSTSTPRQSYSSTSRPNERRPAKPKDLCSLPKFHPANFPSKDPSLILAPPRNTRPLASQPRPARGSDAQQKLQQYQRELVANATQSSRSLLLNSLDRGPVSPRLTPLSSPIDSMTPLTLEGQGDYLLAGSIMSPPAIQEGDGREVVERLVRRENQRRRHPEARSGSVSPALSPAVSPAGGRG